MTGRQATNGNKASAAVVVGDVGAGSSSHSVQGHQLTHSHMTLTVLVTRLPRVSLTLSFFLVHDLNANAGAMCTSPQTLYQTLGQA